MSDFWKVAFFAGLFFVIGFLFGISSESEGKQDQVSHGFISLYGKFYRVQPLEVAP